MFKLVIQDDEGKTTVVPLIRDEITVGRKEGNTIRLTERNVSRRHARILRNNGTIAIEDLESYNGVRVNGSRIKGRQPLTVSDRIQIGDYLIELKTDSDESLATAPDEMTQPIEKPEPPASASMGSIPIPQVGPNAETTKMPSQLVPSHAKNEMFSSVVSAAGTPAPAVEPPPAAPAAEAPAGKGSRGMRKAKGSPEATPVVDEARPARLVVLSSNFAGVEYELTESSTVVGRTDDNDIVINHRSISRNHAKIVREGASYTIVDLQSSNGVRVNNEEYDKVQLQRGDLVDLGHVRLRFADPGDDYAFKPEDVSDVSTGSSKGMWYALLAVLVVLVGVGLFALVSDGGDKDPQGGTDKGSGTAPATAGAVAKTELEGLMAEAQKAMEERDWAVASVKAREAQRAAGSDTAAQQAAQKVIDRAAAEETFKTRSESLRQAIERKDYPKIREHFAAIDEQSAYRAEAQAAHDKERDAYIDRVAQQAENLLEERKCPQIRTLQKEAAAQWPEAGERVSEILETCQKPRTPANPQVTPTRPPPPGPDPVTQPENPPREETDEPEEDPRAPTKSFEELVTEAEEAGRKGLFGQARRLCSQALKLKPRDGRASVVCAIAACNLDNEQAARRYYASAPTQEHKNQIYQICRSKGIEVRQ